MKYLQKTSKWWNDKDPSTTIVFKSKT